MHFLDVLQKSDIMLLTMGKNMEGGGGGVAFSKHDQPRETKENWQVLYGSMQMDEIVVITGKTKYYQCIKSYEGQNGSMNLCWMQQIVGIFHFKLSKLPSTPSMKMQCETWS